jgi:hypothetical protein
MTSHVWWYWLFMFFTGFSTGTVINDLRTGRIDDATFLSLALAILCGILGGVEWRSHIKEKRRREQVRGKAVPVLRGSADDDYDYAGVHHGTHCQTEHGHGDETV